MTAFRTVAVLGASGLLGKPVVQQLSKAGFDLTLISRDSSKLESAFPGLKAKFVQADPSDSTAYQDAFQGATRPPNNFAFFKRWLIVGIDAVVSLVGAAALTQQKGFIDAAVAAGVNRFLPSEFGCDTQAPYL